LAKPVVEGGESVFSRGYVEDSAMLLRYEATCAALEADRRALIEGHVWRTEGIGYFDADQWHYRNCGGDSFASADEALKAYRESLDAIPSSTEKS
jgi:hypothetical protein